LAGDFLDSFNNFDDSPAWLVKSLSKAMRILSCFTLENPEISLADISRKLDIPKNTALNILRTLELYGMVTRTTPSMNYRLGYNIMHLNYCVQSSIPAIRAAFPVLENLQQITGKTIYLTTHINGNVFYLDVIHQNQRIFSYSSSGRLQSMHNTGCGKAMMAFLPQEQIHQIIDNYGLSANTMYTITSADALMKELDLTRKRGYAIDNQEDTLGISCIAAPILNKQGYPTAAVSVSGTSHTMQEESALQYLDPLLNACYTLSSNANEFPAGQTYLLQQKLEREK
jgi:DNA-binding IclR family transcriptional regulator